MKAVKVVTALAGLAVVFLGLVFLIGGRPLTGAMMLLVGGTLLAVGLRLRSAAQNVTIRRELELTGDVSLESMKCSMCGASLSAENVTEKAGAVFVRCPYCHGEYQIEEAPKW